MTKRFAVLVGVLGLACGAAGSVRPSASAETATSAVPMTGTVVSRAGLPIAGANVAFIRYTTSAFAGQGMEIHGQSRTDEQGRFSLGTIALKNELSFPVENGLRLAYTVMASNGERLEVDEVNFTAPRDGSAIASIAADIRAH